MAIIINANTRVMVQGITGRQGSFHTSQMLAYGTNIVAGVAPGKGGQIVQGIPVFNSVKEAVTEQKPDASILFIPAPLVKNAAKEAIENGIRTLVIITEHVPLHDALSITEMASANGTRVIGPNTFGLISPGQCKMGIMPNKIYQPGKIGVIARSGTLSYEIVHHLSEVGLGQSSVIGLGGDRVVGISFLEGLKELEADPDTEAIVLVGEIGGDAEERAAEYISSMKKPVVAYLAGRSAPPGKRMGHAGAIIERGKGTFQGKVAALEAGGAKVAEYPWDVVKHLKNVL